MTSAGRTGTLAGLLASPEADADSYPIQVSDRNGDLWERYDQSTTDLLLRLVQGEVSSELLNESWTNREVLFQPCTDEA